MNRANPALLDYMQYYLDNTDALKGESYRLAKEFGQMLLTNCREAVGTAPLYRDGQHFTSLDSASVINWADFFWLANILCPSLEMNPLG